MGQPKKTPFNLHVVEGFENSTGLPPDWKIFNDNKDAAWEVVTNVANTGNRCIGFNNCEGNGANDMTGTKDWLVTAPYDLSKATTVSISFDVAYAALDFKGKIYADSLTVYCSVNSGATWVQIYKNGGESLSNFPPITTSPPCWTPTSHSEWRTDIIPLNQVAGKPTVLFAFENRSDWGQWIYLDNITINATNGADNCDGVTYAKSIEPIMKSECATPGCHVPGGSGPTDLTSFAGVKSIVDNGSLKKRMVDGNPDIMPPSGKLADSTLSKVVCWINAGAPAN